VSLSFFCPSFGFAPILRFLKLTFFEIYEISKKVSFKKRKMGAKPKDGQKKDKLTDAEKKKIKQ
jgi:hypothetical protein